MVLAHIDQPAAEHVEVRQGGGGLVQVLRAYRAPLPVVDPGIRRDADPEAAGMGVSGGDGGDNAWSKTLQLGFD